LSYFDGLEKLGKGHFQGLFSATRGTTIVEVLKFAYHFPRFMVEEENHNLMEKFSVDELKGVFSSFEKTRVLDLMGGLSNFSRNSLSSLVRISCRLLMNPSGRVAFFYLSIQLSLP